MFIYVVTSQSDYDHSYADQYINCVTSDLQKAQAAFDSVDRNQLSDVALLQVDTLSDWTFRFSLYDSTSQNHDSVRVLKWWTR